MARVQRTTERVAAGDGLPELELVRSTKRRRTVTAYARDGVVVVQLPAGLPRAEELRLVRRMVERVTRTRDAAAAGGDAELTARAHALADRWLDGVRPTSVSWSDRMGRRHGSCTSIDRTIRISRRLAGCPSYVLDYVLVHELAHLVVPGHGAAFWELVERYPRTERARGFLEGLSQAETPQATAPPTS